MHIRLFWNKSEEHFIFIKRSVSSIYFLFYAFEKVNELKLFFSFFLFNKNGFQIVSMHPSIATVIQIISSICTISFFRILSSIYFCWTGHLIHFQRKNGNIFKLKISHKYLHEFLTTTTNHFVHFLKNLVILWGKEGRKAS